MTKKRMGQLFAGLIYLMLWSVMVGFDMGMLLSGRDFILTLLGAAMLALPQLADTKKNGDSIGIAKLWEVFKNQLPISGYMASFILIFSAMTSPENTGHITVTVALCLRPTLYGLVLQMVLGTEENMRTASKTTSEEPKSNYEILRQMGLTSREAEIAVMICRRMSNREIAEELYISETTVKKHISHIFEKLKIDGRDEINDVLNEYLKK